jgi:aspartyl-tRNA(Asn)/glutamyl-tRNA(Gln) amidotransferase subunit C
MAVSEEDVRHVASLARLGIADERVRSLMAELNGILGHMDVLRQVKTATVPRSEGVSSGGAWLRTDEGPSAPLAQPPITFAPAMRDGFFIVPRLTSHESVQTPPRERADQDLDTDDRNPATGQDAATAELTGGKRREKGG